MLPYMRIATLFLLMIVPLLQAENWPQWRGPGLDGVSGETGLPVKWSGTENITWKLDLPSRSGATPILWGEYLFLNVADGDNLEFWAVDRTNGKVRWKRPMAEGQLQDQQTQHVFSFTCDGWENGLGDDRNRCDQGI